MKRKHQERLKKLCDQLDELWGEIVEGEHTNVWFATRLEDSIDRLRELLTRVKRRLP